jgi:hypothetical protein
MYVPRNPVDRIAAGSVDSSKDDPGGGQARIALEGGADVVIAGGDGTVRCVAKVLAGTGAPMGLMPFGDGEPARTQPWDWPPGRVWGPLMTF